MNAPEPVFTSSTRASIPSASFLLMMEAQIRNGLSTVPVTSRNAYSLRSAGAISAVWPIMEHPQVSSTWRNRATGRLTLKPGIASSLSSVPPVWPRPRPLIMGTMRPPAAATGARTRDVLSPTPPVECLSTLRFGMSEKSRTSPERSMVSVRNADSGGVMPLQQHGHQPCRGLVVGNLAARVAIDQGRDFWLRQLAAVALFADHVDGANGSAIPGGAHLRRNPSGRSSVMCACLSPLAPWKNTTASGPNS